MLANDEKLMFLREVPIFSELSVEQLQKVADTCEESVFATETYLIRQGEPGGVLYVLINGRAGLEHERRKGHFARIATLQPPAYIGEMTLFDGSANYASAIALEETFALKLERASIVKLIHEDGNMALAIITMLSQLLYQATVTVAEHTRSRPRELQKFFDTF
jgi:CRP-like cAMP-binding protein